MSGDILEGILGGLAGGAERYMQNVDRQAANDTKIINDDIAAQRVANLQASRDKSAMDVAKFRIGAEQDLMLEREGLQQEAVAEERAYQTEATRLKELEPFLAIVRTQQPTLDPEAAMKEAGRIRNEYLASQTTAGKGPSGQEQLDAIKLAQTTYETFPKKQKKQLLEKHGGDILKVYLSIASDFAPGTPGFKPSISEAQQAKIDQGLDADIYETMEEIADMSNPQLKAYLQEATIKGAPEEVLAVIKAAMEPGVLDTADEFKGLIPEVAGGISRGATGLLGAAKKVRAGAPKFVFGATGRPSMGIGQVGEYDQQLRDLIRKRGE